MNKIYGRCEVLSWPDFDNNIHGLPSQIQKQDAAMTYDGSYNIDKKLAIGRFGKYRASLSQCTCPEYNFIGLPCTHMYLIAFYSNAVKIKRFFHFTKK